MLGVGALLTFGTGLFVASEFALVNVEKVDLERQREAGIKSAITSLRALSRTSTHLSAAQLGITLTTLLTGFVAEPALTKMLSPLLLNWGLPAANIPTVSVVFAMLIATVFSFLIGELVPKNMALSAPIRVLRLVVHFQLAFTWFFGPLIRILNANGNALVRLFGVEPKEELSAARSAEELSSLVRRAATMGSLEQDTAKLIEKTLGLSNMTAADIMTPRPKMHSLSREDSAQALIDLAKATGHSRFPVTGEDVDDIVGLVHLKRALAVPAERRSQVPVAALMIDPVRVPETMPLERLMITLREQGFQLAIVIDEYGGTAGIATLEDAVEELVGDLADEHDRARGHVVKLRDGSMSISGLTRPAELVDHGLYIKEDEDYDTLSGFLMAELGKIPEVGDEVQLDTGELRVIAMDGRRVDRIRFIPKGEES